MMPLRSAFALVLLALASGAAAQPRLAFEAERHDFGQFNEGETVTHVFRFTNAGDAPLALSEVRASCGCTTPDWTRDEVAPGASGEITVLFNSSGRPGPFEKTVTVIAPGTDGALLRIVGDVVPEFVYRGIAQGALTFATDDLRVGAIASGEPVQQAFRFQNTGDHPVRIREVRTIPEGAHVVMPTRPIFPGDVAAVMVTVDDPASMSRAGRFDLALMVETDDPDQPTKSLRLSGKVEG